MREIEYRGRCGTKDCWYYGDLKVKNGQPYIVPRDGHDICFKAEPETVGEYTGLKDRNNAKIFEGDIVIFNFPYNPKDKSKRKIIFEQGAFQAIRSGGYMSLSRNFPFLNSQELDCEIVGNIHDNPELLSRERD
jgi:uncharacterized phage protein (TIGR01671 family)